MLKTDMLLNIFVEIWSFLKDSSIESSKEHLFEIEIFCNI